GLVLLDDDPAAAIALQAARGAARAGEAGQALHVGLLRRLGIAGELVVDTVDGAQPVTGQSALAIRHARAEIEVRIFDAVAHAPGRLDARIEILGERGDHRALAEAADDDALGAIGLGPGAQRLNGAAGAVGIEDALRLGRDLRAIAEAAAVVLDGRRDI